MSKMFGHHCPGASGSFPPQLWDEREGHVIYLYPSFVVQLTSSVGVVMLSLMCPGAAFQGCDCSLGLFPPRMLSAA